MRSVKELNGIAILDVAGGKKLGTVDEVVISPDDGKLLGFVMRGGGVLARTEHVIEADDIRSIGPDAITVDGDDLAHVPEAASEAIKAARTGGRSLMGRTAVTQQGTALGQIGDLMLDEDGRRLAAVVIGGGMLGSSDAVPADRIVSVGPDVVVVSDIDGAEESGPRPFVTR